MDIELLLKYELYVKLTHKPLRKGKSSCGSRHPQVTLFGFDISGERRGEKQMDGRVFLLYTHKNIGNEKNK